MQWGFVAGAIVSAVWIHVVAAGNRPSHVGPYNVIPFANLSLLLGMLSILSLGWTPPRAWFDAGLKLLAGAAGLYTSYLSGTRGSWLAIPVLAVIVVAASRRLRLHHKAAIFAVVMGGMTLVAYFSRWVKLRIAEAMSEFSLTVPTSALDTSVGVRLQLWQASIEMFMEHPLTGVGPEGFSAALDALAARSEVTPLAASLMHSHNDLLFAMATLGVPGLCAVLATYLVPAWFFLRHLRLADPAIRWISFTGLACCLGFLAFGLTEAMFVIAVTNAFYTLVMAACFAGIVIRRQQLASVPPPAGQPSSG